MQNFTGNLNIEPNVYDPNNTMGNHIDGVFKLGTRLRDGFAWSTTSVNPYYQFNNVSIDASRQIRTDIETRMKNIGVQVYILAKFIG